MRKDERGARHVPDPSFFMVRLERFERPTYGFVAQNKLISPHFSGPQRSSSCPITTWQIRCLTVFFYSWRFKHIHPSARFYYGIYYGTDFPLP